MEYSETVLVLYDKWNQEVEQTNVAEELYKDDRCTFQTTVWVGRWTGVYGFKVYKNL